MILLAFCSHPRILTKNTKILRFFSQIRQYCFRNIQKDWEQQRPSSNQCSPAISVHKRLQIPIRKLTIWAEKDCHMDGNERGLTRWGTACRRRLPPSVWSQTAASTPSPDCRCVGKECGERSAVFSLVSLELTLRSDRRGSPCSRPQLCSPCWRHQRSWTAQL